MAQSITNVAITRATNHLSFHNIHLPMIKPIMHILGLCNGAQGGNAEILLKIALTAARESAAKETTISWTHVPSVVVPRDASNFRGTMHNPIEDESDIRDSPSNEIDDRLAFKNAILDADAIIVTSETHNKQPPGYLKVVMDQVGGPEMG